MRSRALAVVLASLLFWMRLGRSRHREQVVSWSGIAFAFQGHTTLAEAGLPHGDIRPDEPGELIVTADPVPVLNGAAPDFSAAPTEPRRARMYCFHPDGTNMSVRGELPVGWQPPGE